MTDRTRNRLLAPRALAAATLLAAAAPAVHAQDAADTEDAQQTAATPADTTTDTNRNGAEGGLPDLDALLGLDDTPAPADAAGDEAIEALDDAMDPDRVELERQLTSAEAADRLASAVQQMNESAYRLAAVRDTGVVTQRLHEEVINKLDVLIRRAEQQQASSSSGSSSSSSSTSSMQRGQDAQGQPQQQQAQAQGQQPGGGAGGGNPAFEQDPGDQLDAARAAWGALPERVRERLLQGGDVRFSDMYRLLTESYYRRIAEEANQ